VPASDIDYLDDKHEYLCYDKFMPFKSIMKNPIFMIGLLFMFIFLNMAGPKLGWWQSRSDKLRPTSCKAVIVKLERRIPANWRAGCEGVDRTNLFVEIKKEFSEDTTQEQLRPLLYRELANDLISIAKNSPTDNLERTPYVRVKMINEKLILNALSEGHFVSKLSTLRDPKLISEHLKVTVQIQELKQ
jgi:hypothetical protein